MSKSTFKKFNFHPAVQRWFAARFGEPSPPQLQGWPAIAEGKHTLILAPTGSGKTLAAFLWCIDNLFRAGLEIGEKHFARNTEGVHTLYISPLKALNNDIHRNLQEPLKGIEQQALAIGLNPPTIRTLVRTGDTPPHIRRSMLKQPPHILITTPESLYLLLTSGRGRELFRGLQYLIVDEIHALSNSKRGVHLSLSLERLMPLCQREPVRIGLSATQRPLERIAAFLGGQQFHGERPAPRPVTIVDCGQRKEMDVKVISPVESFSDLPDATVWPAVIEKLYELIRSHRTTLAFVNMRAQTERVARLLNELHQKNTGDPQAQLALAHHGSISREMRYDIEERLKAGTIPAVIATASLELGIDIGSIDLVVQVESPRSVSSALQRVGRSGHLLSATSKGRLIPLYPSDLDDTVALTESMMSGEIEETIIPENCLDVLAQQIVAELAMRDWDRLSLFRLVRQSYCYRNLSLVLFDHVVDMLAGRFSESELRALQPRIAWDKVNDRLIARRGARMMATMNGGTIPDRGYYSVYLADSNTKLGEMEEEFVFESRVGNVFFLGNNEWRIDQIQRDRIVVAPVQAVKPRPPFWKGDTLYRDFATSQKIGAFRRQFGEDSSKGLSHQDLADDSAVVNLHQFLQRQQELTGKLPTDQQIVVEWFRDSVGEPHVIIHTCFGARVNGLWAIALATYLENRHRAQVQYSYNDDGIIMRVLDLTDPFPIDELLRLPTDEIETLIRDALLETPIFSIRFRYNAARALILPRSQPNQRIPLWLQRLRAADLLQVARQYADFPIIIETYRDCLQDVFDLPSLRKALEDLKRGDISVHVAHTPYPSPMASGLMFNFLANNLYETDRSRMPGQVAAVSSELLAQILSQDKIPTIVTPELIAEFEARWQNHAPEFQARDAEDLFAIVARLAPISDDELLRRCKADPNEWLDKLQKENRVVRIAVGWISAEDANLFDENPSLEIVKERVRRFLRVHGPVGQQSLAQQLARPADAIDEALRELYSAKEVVRGQLVVGVDEEVWCDRHNFAELYRRAVALRRAVTAPADRQLFYRFLLRWHHLTALSSSVMDLIKRYAGFRFPISVFEREIVCTRLGDDLQNILQDFYELISRGEVIARALRENEDGRIKLDFIPRGSGEMFSSRASLLETTQELDPRAQKVFSFLKENGASLVRDIITGAGLSALETRDALAVLAKSGLASCEQYGIFLSVIQSETAPSKIVEEENWLPGPLPAWTQRGRRTRPEIRAQVSEQIQLSDSRWFLIPSFAVMGKEISDDERAERQARLLLTRYGILVKEWYRREQGLLPWHQLFQVLKRLEWQGEVRRGYFIAGLSGVQFALPAAVELLEKVQSETASPSQQALLVSTADPALPFGGAVDWDLTDVKDNKIQVTRGSSNHLIFIHGQPVLYSENFGGRLWRLTHIPEASLDSCIQIFKSWLQLPASLRPRRRIEISQINEQPASDCKLAEAFVRTGFERDGEKLVLWPSGV